MTIIDQIRARAAALCPHIVLSEGGDARVVAGGLRAARDGLARITVLASDQDFAKAAGGSSAASELTCIDPGQSPDLVAYARAYRELRKAKGCTEDQARAVVSGGLGFAAMMVRQGDADGTLGGAVATTADTVRTALQVIGRRPGIRTVSSCFLMLLGAPHSRPVIFADCGLVLQPTAEELADIAISSTDTFRDLIGGQPRVAMLSFSTRGSVPAGAHESLSRIHQAMARLAEMRPDLAVDGELQFDAAIDPDVAKRKAPGSAVGGAADVFVFPSLSAGNIGYKIAQRVGGATALGPILQGLAKPANDLSRGCTADDVYDMIAITAAQTAAG